MSECFVCKNSTYHKKVVKRIFRDKKVPTQYLGCKKPNDKLVFINSTLNMYPIYFDPRIIINKCTNFKRKK